MQRVLNYLLNLKLSVTQILMGLMAGAIAFLVAAFELQGTKLHKTQVDLLRATYNAKMDQQDKAVDSARLKFLDALDKYEASK